MAATTSASPFAASPGLDEIRAGLDEMAATIGGLIDQLGSDFPTEADAGGWTVRQLLSHLIGALQRVPVHAGYFLVAEGGAVPIAIGDDYWIAEWETAPACSFRLAFDAAVAGNRAFLGGLDPHALGAIRPTPFGDATLAGLLHVSYAGHAGRFHGQQLRGFLERD